MTRPYAPIPDAQMTRVLVAAQGMIADGLRPTAASLAVRVRMRHTTIATILRVLVETGKLPSFEGLSHSPTGCLSPPPSLAAIEAAKALERPPELSHHARPFRRPHSRPPTTRDLSRDYWRCWRHLMRTKKTEAVEI